MYSEGLGSSFELSQAQTELTTSQINYSQAVYNLIVARYNLKNISKKTTNNKNYIMNLLSKITLSIFALSFFFIFSSCEDESLDTKKKELKIFKSRN